MSLITLSSTKDGGTGDGDYMQYSSGSLAIPANVDGEVYEIEIDGQGLKIQACHDDCWESDRNNTVQQLVTTASMDIVVSYQKLIATSEWVIVHVGAYPQSVIFEAEADTGYSPGVEGTPLSDGTTMFKTEARRMEPGSYRSMASLLVAYVPFGLRRTVRVLSAEVGRGAAVLKQAGAVLERGDVFRPEWYASRGGGETLRLSFRVLCCEEVEHQPSQVSSTG